MTLIPHTSYGQGGAPERHGIVKGGGRMQDPVNARVRVHSRIPYAGRGPVVSGISGIGDDIRRVEPPRGAQTEPRGIVFVRVIAG